MNFFCYSIPYACRSILKLQSFAFIPLLFLVNIELEKRVLLNGKLEILVPKDFKEMTSEMLDFKYPKTNNRPTFVLTDEDATVNLAFSHLSTTANNTVIESYKNNVKASYQKSFPTAQWKGDGVLTINNKQVGYLKLITQALDQKVYNYIFMTDLEGRLLVGTFNCTENLMPEWEEAAEKIIMSLRVK